MPTYQANCIYGGYYYRPAVVHVDKRLSDHESAQCGVKISDDEISLISYETLVCTITKDGWCSCTGTYSRTTAKHITWFLREYAPSVSYYDMKKCYEKSIMYNMYTGEIKNLN